MVTPDDLGIALNFPDFCKGCKIADLEIKTNEFREGNMKYIVANQVICHNRRVCEALYERIKPRRDPFYAEWNGV